MLVTKGTTLYWNIGLKKQHAYLIGVVICSCVRSQNLLQLHTKLHPFEWDDTSFDAWAYFIHQMAVEDHFNAVSSAPSYS